MEDREDGLDRRITQLRKGILELAVMAVLYRGRQYGYSLVRVLAEHSGASLNGASLKEGTVYPILARLDREGTVRSEWVESGQGPPRKYYALTPAGRRLFTELSQELDRLVSLVKQDWGLPDEPEAAGTQLFVRRK